MNTMTAERPPAKAPRMRYPEQALAELKLEDPNTPVTVLHDPQAGRCRHDPLDQNGPPAAA